MKHDYIHKLQLRDVNMLSSSFKCYFQSYFINIIQLNRQVSIQGVRSLFQSYISSLIKLFKHNTILDIHLLHRSYYSNLNKSFRHNTFLGIHLSYRCYFLNPFKLFTHNTFLGIHLLRWSYHLNLIKSFNRVAIQVFVCYVEVTIEGKFSGRYELNILKSILNLHNSFQRQFSVCIN